MYFQLENYVEALKWQNYLNSLFFDSYDQLDNNFVEC